MMGLTPLLLPCRPVWRAQISSTAMYIKDFTRCSHSLGCTHGARKFCPLLPTCLVSTLDNCLSKRCRLTMQALFHNTADTLLQYTSGNPGKNCIFEQIIEELLCPKYKNKALYVTGHSLGKSSTAAQLLSMK